MLPVSYKKNGITEKSAEVAFGLSRGEVEGMNRLFHEYL